jgi:hypothetical protein
MLINVSEERITSFFRVENQPSKKPGCSRWLDLATCCGLVFGYSALVFSTRLLFAEPATGLFYVSELIPA